MSFSILSAILLMPLIAMIIVIMAPRSWGDNFVRYTATLFTAAAMVLSIVAFAQFYGLDDRTRSDWCLVQSVEWMPKLGINYIVGMDGLNAPMILLSGILSFAAVLVSFNIKERVKEYYALTLASITGVFGIFMALDLFFFILFYEMASVPMYFLVGMWGTVPKSGPRKVSIQYAATKLILYLQLGGGLAFFGILALYFNVDVSHVSGGLAHTFDLRQIMATLNTPGHQLPHAIQMWLFPVMFIGFAVEAGFFPFHTWLPDGHSSAPTALSMLLAGVLLKMGSYGVLRLAIAPMVDGAHTYMPYMMYFAAINVMYGALCALRQVDIKYLIAYSSVSHMGIVFLGLGTINMGTGNMSGMEGAVFQMFSHGIVTAMLFALAGYIYEKTHTRNIEEMGGLAVKMPFLAATFSMAALASLGLPALSGFVAEVMVFFGLWTQRTKLCIFVMLAMVVTATYLLRCVQKIFFGPRPEPLDHTQDAHGVERLAPIILGLTSLVVGLYPELLLHVMGPSVTSLLEHLTTLGGIR